MINRSAVTMLVLLVCSLFITSCSAGYYEQCDYLKKLDSLAEMPTIDEGSTLLFSGESGGETVIEIKSDVFARWAYEQRLDYLWYKSIDTQPEMEDRISTYLHPTGWRVAIYDNRRNADLKAKYGTEDYVWQVRICNIKVNVGEFPLYPESGEVLWIDEKFSEEYEAFPRETLPENFPDLPECSLFVDAGKNEYGLHFSFITTYTDFGEFIKSISNDYKPNGYCYADDDHNYFYVTYEHLIVVDPKEETSEELQPPENSYPEEVLQEMEKHRIKYHIEELPPRYDESGELLEPNLNDYCRITILFVRAEWVPEWWEFKE